MLAQLIAHDVLAVGLGPGAGVMVLVTVDPTGCDGGTKQVVWHKAACELQVIMQFVVVEVCASRMTLPASAASAAPQTAKTVNETAKPRMA